MDRSTALQLAQQLQTGKITPDELADQVCQPRSAQLAQTTIDLDRARRCGYPEVVFGEGKSVEMLTEIFQRQCAEQIEVLATRVDADKAAQLAKQFPQAHYNTIGRTFRITASETPTPRTGKVAVVTAGTSDLPVAEEAAETLDWMGVATNRLSDVGVAGPHRLVERLDELCDAQAVVVVAGMEGALPSVVGGYLAVPVIAVPTQVGYGASFGGLAALLGMLNSCAANVAVVNIDAGFKAGYLAGLIAAQTAGAAP